MNLLRCAKVSLVALGVTVAPVTRGQIPSPGPVIQLRVPPTIGRLTMQRRRDYEDPSEGVQLRYVGADSLPIDVFVYPGPDLASECSLECAGKVMHDEIEIFQSAFPEMIHRHYVDSISVVRNDSLAAGAGAPWALARQLTLAVVRNGAPQRSDFVLYYLPGYRIKIRATYIATPANVDVVKAFLEAAVPALTGTADSPAPP
jgi:hypothetical protein